MIETLHQSIVDKRLLQRCMACLLMLAVLGGCASTTPQRSTANQTEVMQRTIALAVGFLRAGKFNEAKDTLNKALAIEPKNTLALATLGVAFEMEGEHQLAERQFKRALSIAPRDAQTLNTYAAFLYKMDRLEEAKGYWTTAAEDTFFALRPQIFANLGRVNKRLGDLEAAEQAYVRAVELNPSLPQGLLSLANLRYDQRNYVEAKFYHERYESVAPQTAEALWLCIRIARVFGDKNKEASCSLALKNIFPATEEYRLFEESQS